MEIALVNSTSIRIKGKHGTFIVDPPTSGSKTPADGILLLNGSSPSSYAVEGSRLTIVGPGEYEIAGIKVTTIGLTSDLVHTVRVDNIEVVIGSAEAIDKLHDKLNECHIVVVRVNDSSAQAAITALAPRVVVFYGTKAQDEAKNIGKEVKEVNKYAVTSDKLPADMEVVVLG